MRYAALTLSTLCLPAALSAQSPPVAYTLEELQFANKNGFTELDLKRAKARPELYKMENLEIVIDTLKGPFKPEQAADPSPGRPPLDILPLLDSVINIGKTLWPIVEENRPVVDVKTQYATAVPKGVADWAQLSGWKPPEATRYGFVAKNKLGGQMIRLDYDVIRAFGGGYKGTGLYLTGVTASPSLVDVAWGYKLYVSMEVPDSSVVNAGTSGAPIAGMMVNLKWRIVTPLQESSGTGVYYVQGDGLFKEVGGPFRRREIKRAQAMLEGLQTDWF